jgi:hypothetical protein
MTQNSTLSLSLPWHDAQAGSKSINPLTKRWVLTMSCTTPLSSTDLDDLQEIRQGIVGLAIVRLSKNKRDLFIEFVDPSVTLEDMSALTTELFRQAMQHNGNLPRRRGVPQQVIMPAMAVHSEVGRLDEYDR